MNDVAVVLLSTGEPYAARAFASVERQTLAPVEVVRVGTEVQPFHRAMNAAAARVRAEFFLQVDADMVLNSWCIAQLRAFMHDDVGMVLAPLWDPLMGAEAGIKLFRTECVRQVPFLDTAAPDSDFYDRSHARGWKVAYVLPSPGTDEREAPWPTFGHHRPEYSPSYTFARFRLIGTRYLRRRDFTAFRWRFERLGASRHARALLARIALCLGVFRDDDGDRLGPSLNRAEREASWLQRFLDGPSADSPCHEPAAAREEDSEEMFSSWHDVGARCRRAADRLGFVRCLDVLDHRTGEGAWYARAGLCHGLAFDRCSPRDLRSAHDAVRDLLSGGALPRPCAEVGDATPPGAPRKTSRARS